MLFGTSQDNSSRAGTTVRLFHLLPYLSVCLERITCKSCCFASTRLRCAFGADLKHTADPRTTSAALNLDTAPPLFKVGIHSADFLFFLHLIMFFISSTSCWPDQLRILYFKIKLILTQPLTLTLLRDPLYLIFSVVFACWWLSVSLSLLHRC